MLEVSQDYEKKVLEEAKSLYHKTKSIYEAMGYGQAYQLGQIWESGNENMRQMVSIINSSASAVESVRLTQHTYMFSVNPATHTKERVVDWYLAYLDRHGPSITNLDISIQESAVTDPAVCVSRAGRILTPDFLRTLILTLEIQKYCSLPSKLRVLELGGGCGYLARTLKLFTPNMTHIDVDIPETLYFAYLFLRLNFPNATVRYVTDPSDLKGSLEEFDFVFIPTLFAECILPYEFDLFCNTASLGEMANPVIRYWMDFVQNRLKIKYFFGLNRFLNTLDPNDAFGQRRLNENECSVLFDANWRILQWEVEPPFARCPYEETIVTRNLEIIAERVPKSSSNQYDNESRSQQNVEDLMDEDWVR